MTKIRHLTALVAGLICSLLISQTTARADDAAPAVSVTYQTGSTEVIPVKAGTRYFSNRNYILRNPPDEINGLMITRRAGGQRPQDVKLDVPAGATVYLILNSDVGAESKTAGVADMHASLAASNWTRLPEEAQYGPVKREYFLAIYKRTFDEPAHLTLHSAAFAGIDVAAANLTVVAPATTEPDDNDVSDSTTSIVFGTAGPVTHIASTQTSTQVLEAANQDNGPPIAGVYAYSLTAALADHDGRCYFRFASPVGASSRGALDDALRSLSSKYANIDAAQVEFCFGGAAANHDDPAIGLATAVLLRSMIDGFAVDSHVAIAGDFSADGRVSPIPAINARFRAASAAGCKIIVIPAADYERLLDARIYLGIPAMLSPQVVGISSLDDAIASARVDRPIKLAQAIEVCGDVCRRIKQSPAYLQSDDAKNRLRKAITLAPNHLTARLLLSVALNRVRYRLSPEASEYFTFAAATNFLPDLYPDDSSAATRPTARTSDHDELQLLRKVRPIADLKIQPLIDAWSEYVEMQTAFNTGRASTESYMLKRQALLQQMQNLKLDRESAEKIVRAGI